MQRAFTLVEVLVVLAILGVLVSILLPALSHAREAGRATSCLSNHRQNVLACRMYADENKGWGPALGEPYAALPNWGLVVQQASGRCGTAPGDLYSAASSLVCPSIRAFYAREMTRTYAANATGLAGLAGDRADFDTPAPGPYAHVRYDLVPDPSHTPVELDSAIAAPPTGSAPPPTRTASVLDLRNAGHVANRIARRHAGQRAFQAGMFDGSAASSTEVPAAWLAPLP